MDNNIHHNKSVLLLAAGEGKRLQPLTLSIPKPLIKLDNQSLIQHHLERLALNDIKKIYVNRAYLRDCFEKVLNKHNCFGIDIHYLDEPDGALETAGAIINTFHHCDTDELVVINSDIWTEFDYNDLLTHPLTSDTDAHLILVSNPKHHPLGDFSLQNELLVKPQRLNKPSSTLTFSGMGIYHRRFIPSTLMNQQPVKKAPLKPLLDKACHNQKVSAFHYKGAWFDIGTIERLKEAERYLKSIKN